MKMTVHCDDAECSLVDVSEMPTASITKAMMKALSTSETSVNFYQATRRNVPKDNHLQTRGRENLKCDRDKRIAQNFVGQAHF